MEIENFFKKINTVKENIKLSKSDKDSIRQKLLSEIANTTVPVSVSVFSPYSSPWFSPSNLFPSRARYAAISTFIIFAGAGVSFAAQGSIPGDFLYPVKVNFNEKVAATLKPDPVDRAEYEITLANRRLEEIKILESKNKLDAKTKSDLQEDYNNHTIVAQEKINLSGEENVAQLIVNLQESINSAKQVFEIKESESVGTIKVAPKKKPTKVLPNIVSTTTTNTNTNTNTNTGATITIPGAIPVTLPVNIPTTVDTNLNSNTNQNTNPVNPVTNTVNNTINNTVAPVVNSLPKLGL